VKKLTKTATTKISVVVPKMNDNLYAVYASELEARQSKVKDILRFQRERGKVIERVKTGFSLDGRSKVDYGDNAVEVLADYLGIHRSYAYKLSSFYEIYRDNEKFQDMLDKFEDKGYSLSWSHFNFLVHVDDDTREELIGEIIEKKMSVRDLQKVLSDKKIEVEAAEPEADGIVDSFPVKDSSNEVNATTLSAEDSEDQEDDVEEEPEARVDRDSSIDIDVPSPKITLKSIVTTAGKFGDKLVDLVGNLTMGLGGTHGSSAHKDIFKGLSSAKEVLHSLKQQVDEYYDQLDSIHNRLLSDKKESD
jgi:hypothetical protein